MNKKRFLSIAFVIFFSSVAWSSTPVEQAARDVQLWEKLYTPGLRAVAEFSQMHSEDPNDIIERDLAICETIGRTYQGFSDYFGKLGKFHSALFQDRKNEEAEKIEVLQEGTLPGYYNLRNYCFSSKPEYRKIPALQQRLRENVEVLKAIRELTVQYSPEDPE